MKEREKIIWRNMWRRCTKPGTPDYERYGGRGITVCARWKDYALFLVDMGRSPSPKHSIDRIDNDDGYWPGNCRWATSSRQNRNKRSTHWVVYRGKRMSLADAVDLAGVVDFHDAQQRIAKMGWPTEKAVETPIRPMSPRGTGQRRDREAREKREARMRQQQQLTYCESE